MVFDGACGFCRYWLVKWKKVSGDRYDYEPFQTAAERFQDIPKVNFQKAVQLIFPNGEVYSGAAVAYYPYYESGKITFLYRWYRGSTLFEKLSDWLYRRVAKNRNFAFKISKLIFGKNPYANATPRVFALVLLLIFFVVFLNYLN